MKWIPTTEEVYLADAVQPDEVKCDHTVMGCAICALERIFDLEDKLEGENHFRIQQAKKIAEQQAKIDECKALHQGYVISLTQKVGIDREFASLTRQLEESRLQIQGHLKDIDFLTRQLQEYNLQIQAQKKVIHDLSEAGKLCVFGLKKANEELSPRAYLSVPQFQMERALQSAAELESK